MNLLAKLRAMSANGTATPKQWSSFTEGPRNSADLERVLALPRRELVATEALAAEWTARLKRPTGTMSLRPIQAAALAEAEAAGGLFGMLGAGWGKTLLSLLLPTVWESRVAVLLVPASLKSKLWDLEYPALAKEWFVPNVVGHPLQYTDVKGVLHVVPYTTLSSAKHHDILERIRPDVVVCDEGHSLRHSSSARTKRFRRYVRLERKGVQANPVHPGAHPSGDVVGGNRGGDGARRLRLAFLSGTFTSDSLRDYAHLLDWCLGANAPVPLDWNELQAWSYVLDATEFPAPDGALRRLCADGESVRVGFRRRLVETPGVVATTDNDPGVSLVFRRPEITVPSEIHAALAKLRAEWRLPDGTPKREAIEVYAASRQLASGFFYKTVYPRGESPALIREWNDARRNYYSEVRERLALGRKGEDSFLQLWRLAASGKWASEHWKAWSEIRKAVEPATETVWISRAVVDAAIAWAKEAPGIVWVESEALKAAFEIGIPVYETGKQLPAFNAETGKRSVAASINAFQMGANLQMFNRSLIVTCPPSGALLEQVIRRTFRHGQEREVFVDFFQHTPEFVKALEDAREKAKYIEETQGQRQALNIGAWAF